ncbi:hypothetical protein EK21DRAFT_109324 [Setomelanomma holmii]|uniref:Uncharacterized protein n=1 Tax=Setomelanomma holmii TaxID=210430 RepID=A0A9P4HDQ1_9PLEO|nr:hypothetical protein EK21DRAFT_109324 [Setomelanomma holmii]
MLAGSLGQVSRNNRGSHQERINEFKEDLAAPHTQDWEHLKKELERMREALRSCNEPAKYPNLDTFNNLHALDHFSKRKRGHTSWLIASREIIVQLGIHVAGIVGRYFVFILMTKVPGVSLDWTYMCGLTLEERIQIREDSKKSLINGWEYGIRPNDTALRNLIWDQDYIVDFEDYSDMKIKDSEAWWEERYYEDWEIDGD